MKRRKRSWVKLWPSILDDEQIEILNGEQWRLVIEVFLVLGRTDPDLTGRLPNIQTIHRHLRRRLSLSELASELDKLCDITDVIAKDKNGYFVPNWIKYQEDRRTTWQREKGDSDPNEPVLSDTVSESDAESDSESDARSTEVQKSRRLEEQKSKKGASPFSDSVSFDASVEVDTTAPEIDHRHAVIAIWQEILHRYPPKTRWHEIVNVVGVETLALRRLLTVWKSKKWNPTDVDGILERYRMSRASEIDALVVQEKKLNEQITIDQMLKRAQNGQHRSQSH